MKIPEKITIVGIDYEVKEVPINDPKLNYGHMTGSQYSVNQSICLSEDNKGDYKNQVFVHELVHAICDALNISHETIVIDERFVESFSQILYQVIKQLE